MANTKVIKLWDGSSYLIPVSNSDVQQYGNTSMSVTEAIGLLAYAATEQKNGSYMVVGANATANANVTANQTDPSLNVIAPNGDVKSSVKVSGKAGEGNIAAVTVSYNNTTHAVEISTNATTNKGTVESVSLTQGANIVVTKTGNDVNTAFTIAHGAAGDVNSTQSASDATLTYHQSMVTGVQIDQFGHVKGVTSKTIQDVTALKIGNKSVYAYSNVGVEVAGGTNKITIGDEDVTITPEVTETFTPSADTTQKANNLVDVVIGLPASVTSSEGTLGVTYTTYQLPTKEYIAEAIADKFADVAAALVYEGTVARDADLPTNLGANDKGKVYVVSAEGTYAGKACEVGDYLVWNGSSWDALNGENQVSADDPTLAWGTQSKVATVDGTDLHVTMPASPFTDITLTPSGTGHFLKDLKLTPSGTSYTLSYIATDDVVTSITLTQGDGITVSDSGTAVTSTGTRTITHSTPDGAKEGKKGDVAAKYLSYVTTDKFGHVTSYGLENLPAANVESHLQGSSTTNGASIKLIEGSTENSHVELVGSDEIAVTYADSKITLTHATHAAQTIAANGLKTLSITTNGYGHVTAATQTDIPTMGAATSSAAGTKGLVPASAAGDENKVLGADAKWHKLDTTSTNVTNLHYAVSDKNVTMDDTFLNTLGTFSDGGTVSVLSNATL